MLAALNPFRELTLLSVLLRFALAVVCSAVIGYERSKNRHAAGLRTHIVVCIAAASIMILNQYLLTFFNAGADPARLGAQVVSGVGFLGAGSILITGHQRGQHIKGLTTAAGLWASACMGLVIGSGFYELAVIMCVILFIVFVILNRLDGRYLKDSAVMRFYIEYGETVPFSSILGEIHAHGWNLTSWEHYSVHPSPINGTFIDIQRNGHDSNRALLLEALRQIEGVCSVVDT